MSLNKKNVLFASLAFGWITIFWYGFDTLIQTININTLGLMPSQSGYILAIDNILGLFVLPLFGWLSDKCTSKYGRRTPFILIGTVVALVGFLFVGVFAYYRNLWAYIASLVVTLFAMAAYRPAALSFVPDITPEPLRSKANAISNIVSALFNVVAIAIVTPLLTNKYIEDNSYILPIVIGIVLASIVTMVIFFTNVKEPQYLKQLELQLAKSKTDSTEAPALDGAIPNTALSKPIEKEEKKPCILRTEKRNIIHNKVFVLLAVFFFYMAYNALVSNFTSYAGFVLKLENRTLPLILTMAGALIGFYPSTKLAARVGRRKTIFIGFLLMICPFILVSLASLSVIASLLPKPLVIVLVYACFSVAGLGYGFVMVNIYPLYLELEGKNVGQGTGIFAMSMTVAMVITPIVAGYIIEFFGKLWEVSYTVTIQEETITNYGDFRVLVPYSTINLILAIICTLSIKEGIIQSKEEAKAGGLEQKNNE